MLEEGTTLRPESVQARFEADPQDPLFHPLDADDPGAPQLTFEHLKKGLVRVTLPLPDNMDVIDFEGNVTTSADRTIAVWRGVPTVANTALTAPYQLDGRLERLEEQAQAAIVAHSEGPQVSRKKLGLLAYFQRNLFSSPRARLVSELLDYGFPIEKLPAPERYLRLSEQEQRGRELYGVACEGCHGGATTHRIVDREVHDFFFPVLKPDGRASALPARGRFRSLWLSPCAAARGRTGRAGALQRRRRLKLAGSARAIRCE